MFPNVRLLIAALFGSLLTLSCGFAVFAAFRVNHEPLSRLSADTVSLQLVADEAPTPLGSGSRLGEGGVGGATTNAPPPTAPLAPVAAAPATSATPTIASTPAQQLPSAQVPVVQPAPDVKHEAAGKTAEPAKAASPVVTAVQPSPVQAPPVAQPTANVKHEATVKSAEPTKTASPIASAIQPSPIQTPPPVQPAPDVKQEATVKSAEPTKTAGPVAAAPEPAAVQAPPVAPPAEVTGALPKTTAPEAKAAPGTDREAQPRTVHKTARKPVERHRVVARRYYRRRAAPAFAQFGEPNSSFNEPTFESAPNFQPATRRARRTRADVDGGDPSFYAQ